MDLPMMSDKEYDALAKTLSAQGSLALHEYHPDLEQLRIGLSWHHNGFEHENFELGLAAVLLNDAGQVRGPDDLVFYNHPKSACGSVQHLAAKTDAGQAVAARANDEKLLINLMSLPPDVSRIAVIVSIHRAAERGQNFGLVRSAQVTLHKEGQGGRTIANLNLTEDVSLATAAVVGELQARGVRKHRRDFHYVRMGIGDEGGLENLLLDYGLKAS